MAAPAQVCSRPQQPCRQGPLWRVRFQGLLPACARAVSLSYGALLGPNIVLMQLTPRSAVASNSPG